MLNISDTIDSNDGNNFVKGIQVESPVFDECERTRRSVTVDKILDRLKEILSQTNKSLVE